jgi:hypothetical protein
MLVSLAIRISLGAVEAQILCYPMERLNRVSSLDRDRAGPA